MSPLSALIAQPNEIPGVKKLGQDEIRQDDIPGPVRVPVIGTIAAGKPIFCEGDDANALAFGDGRFDFALRVQGVSMTGARIMDGDLAFLRAQDDVDDGQIAAVIIGDHATLKRVYHIKDGVQLVSENPAYPAMTFTGEDSGAIRILGLAVAFQSKIR